MNLMVKKNLPDIKLIYWCGGNPFHHHQDLNTLHQAWKNPDTVIVNEPWWTATAQRADIVFPLPHLTKEKILVKQMEVIIIFSICQSLLTLLANQKMIIKSFLNSRKN